jgi:hypothetical protein
MEMGLREEARDGRDWAREWGHRTDPQSNLQGGLGLASPTVSWALPPDPPFV